MPLGCDQRTQLEIRWNDLQPGRLQTGGDERIARRLRRQDDFVGGAERLSQARTKVGELG